MWLTERGFGEAAVIDVHGALTGSAASELLQMTARAHVLSGSRVLILNLADLTAIDEEGLKTLAAVAAAVHWRRAELRVAGDLDLLAQVGIVSTGSLPYRTYPTVDDALHDIRSALEQRHSCRASGRLQRIIAGLSRIYRNT